MRPTTLVSRGGTGFFSCCSVRLMCLVEYVNQWNTIPDSVDSSGSFQWYKPKDDSRDVTFDYFINPEQTPLPLPSRPISFHHGHQFRDYRTLDFQGTVPLVNRFFSPSEDIQRRIAFLEEKHNLQDYSNVCTLFYRGNDKATETLLPKYLDYLKFADKLRQSNPNIRFLVQSDETEFIELMTRAFPTAFLFKDEIRHIKKQISTVDIIHADQNSEFSKWYLAITIIMSKTKTIICGDGNCSLWIALYRGHTGGMTVFNRGQWNITPV